MVVHGSTVSQRGNWKADGGTIVGIRTPLGSALAAHPDGARGVLINGGEGMWEPPLGGKCAMIPGFNVEGLVLQMPYIISPGTQGLSHVLIDVLTFHINLSHNHHEFTSLRDGRYARSIVW